MYSSTTKDRLKPPHLLVAYFGHHKAGSMWITDMLRSVADELGWKLALAPNPEAFGGAGLYSWARARRASIVCLVNAVYTEVPLELLKGFHVIRDPRDIVVSAYYSHRFSHPITPSFPELSDIRVRLQEMSQFDGIMFEIDLLGVVFEAMATWHYLDGRILELKFEDLIENPQHQFTRIINFLGLALPEKCAVEIVERNSFTSKTHGRNRGASDRTSHYRNGVSGDWRTELNQAHLEYFMQRYPNLLARLGYEGQ